MSIVKQFNNRKQKRFAANKLKIFYDRFKCDHLFIIFLFCFAKVIVAYRMKTQQQCSHDVPMHPNLPPPNHSLPFASNSTCIAFKRVRISKIYYYCQLILLFFVHVRALTVIVSLIRDNENKNLKFENEKKTINQQQSKTILL